MDYSPRETLDVILKRWLVVVLFTLLGGAVGWIFHQLQPPVYEARAIFTISINYSQPDLLDSLDSDHYAEDQMISAAMNIFVSSPVITNMTLDAASLNLAPGDIALDKRIFIERRQAEVTLVVRHEDPQKAAGLANIWAQRGLEALQEAQTHALRVYTLNYLIKSLENCPLEQATTAVLCQYGSQIELDQAVAGIQTELANEIQASKGLTPAVMFSLERLAEAPQSPVMYQTQGLALAGGLLGFLIGLLLSILRIK